MARKSSVGAAVGLTFLIIFGILVYDRYKRGFAPIPGLTERPGEKKKEAPPM